MTKNIEELQEKLVNHFMETQDIRIKLLQVEKAFIAKRNALLEYEVLQTLQSEYTKSKDRYHSIKGEIAKHLEEQSYQNNI